MFSRAHLPTALTMIVFTLLGFFGTLGVLQSAVPLSADVVGGFLDDERERMIAESRTLFLRLPESQRSIAAASYNALAASGYSQEFLGQHLVLQDVQGEKDMFTVQWLLLVGEYRLSLVDHVTVNLRGEQSFTLPDQLGHTADMPSVLSRAKAEALLTECIGPHAETVVTYRSRTVGGDAQFQLEARAANPDVLGAFPVAGIDLVTGECKKGMMR